MQFDGGRLGSSTTSPLRGTAALRRRAIGFGRRFLPVLLVLAVGLALTAVAVGHFTRMGRNERLATMSHTADRYGLAIAEGLRRDVVAVRALESLITAVPSLSAAQFQRIAAAAAQNSMGLDLLEWVPRVATESGTESFPIRHVWPGEYEATAIGFDMARHPARSEALRRARDAGMPAATGRIPLVGRHAGDQGIMVASPVYAAGPVPETVAGRRNALLGFAVGVLRVGTLVEQAIAPLGRSEFDIYLLDHAAPAGERQLHHLPSPAAEAPRPPLDETDLRSGEHWSTSFEVGGRPWTVILRQDDAPMFGGLAWPVGLSGLLITGTMGAYLADITRRRHRRDRMARRLALVNARLEREAGERLAAEDNLRRRSEHLARRIRETNCLYALSRLFTERSLGWEQVCQRAVDLLAAAVSHPDPVGASATCRGVAFATAGFRASPWMLSHDIAAGDAVIGRIELHYCGAERCVGGGDRKLVGAVCERLGKYFEGLAAEEAMLAAKAEAEQANRAKSRFFAAAGHDLRQPLQAMHLFLYLLQSRLGGTENAEIAEKLAEAMRTADSLLDALLQVAKLDAGTVQPDEQTFSVPELLHSVVNEFETQASRKGLDLRLRPSPVTVRSDPVLLGRILGNLVSNAVRYTDSGGVLLGVRRRGRFAHIEVWDTGLGIAPEQIDAVFQEFYQVGNEERDRTRGLGLGLAIVERMSRLLGHDVSVDSRPGRGSVFRVKVPLAAARPAHADLAPAEGEFAGAVVVAIAAPGRIS